MRKLTAEEEREAAIVALAYEIQAEEDDEPFGFRKPTTVLAELKERYEDWDAGRLPDDGFRVYLDRLRDEFDMLVGLGKVTDAEDDSFEDEYSSSLYAVSDVPDLPA